MTNAGPSQGNTGLVGASPVRKTWTGASHVERNYRWTELWLLLFPALFMLLGLITLLLVNGQQIDITAKKLPPLLAFTPVIGLLLALLGAHIALIFVAPDADETLLPIAGLLSSIGVLMSLRLGPDLNQTSLGSKQLVFVIAGLALCVLTVWATHDLRWIRDYPYTWAIIGALLVGVTLAHAGSFNPNAPSRDVLSLGNGGLSFQPSEVFKICLVVFFAGYLSQNIKVLSEGGYRVGPVTLPPVKNLIPLLVVLGMALLIVVFARELGLAVLILGVFLAMLYAASSRISYILMLGGVFAVGAVLIFNIFSYARDRVSLITQAFDPNIYTGAPPLSSYQIVQGLVAFGSGGVFGQGLGLGHPTFVPASTTDYVAASFAEEFGFAGLLALIAIFMLLLYRGMRIAARSRDPFNQLLALGLTAVFGLQTVVILAGNLKLMPLTGVPLPFVAYGGSSLLANYIIIGLLLRLSRERA
ncbi:MAG TPA: FtsW/RodA/SpoVE family cell cycle protein [Ktedonobacterales bacterium]|jgi:cell division protein FtsW (lipid II flippase)|nr:FtsW/RodA/SpoVE family cell cycle protein [Ktedonobacterales bacterium]